MNSRFFLMMGRLNFLSLGNYQNLIKSWPQESFMRKFCDFWLLRPLEAHALCQGRSFRIYSCLKQRVVPSKVDKQKSQSNEKNKAGAKVLIIDETGKESAMYLNEAVKYAKRNKLGLIKMENVGGKRAVYKFDKETDIILAENKSKNNCKKFILRDTIQSHDLEIKINTMFKFVEKGVTVICLIENVSAQNKVNEIASLLKTSKLKDTLINVRNSSKRINLTFQKNVISTKEKVKTENLKTKEKSV